MTNFLERDRGFKAPVHIKRRDNYGTPTMAYVTVYIMEYIKKNHLMVLEFYLRKFVADDVLAKLLKCSTNEIISHYQLHKALLNYHFFKLPKVDLFKSYKKTYVENIRLTLEIRFNEIYWAPTGKGAQELFQKYSVTKF
jgi:hypothetical protein